MLEAAPVPWGCKYSRAGLLFQDVRLLAAKTVVIGATARLFERARLCQISWSWPESYLEGVAAMK